MNQELREGIQRTPEDAQNAIKSANHQLELRRGMVVKNAGDPVRDGGVNFRLGQIDALRWVLSIEGTILEDSVKLYLMTHNASDVEGEQNNG